MWFHVRVSAQAGVNSMCDWMDWTGARRTPDLMTTKHRTQHGSGAAAPSDGRSKGGEVGVDERIEGDRWRLQART